MIGLVCGYVVNMRSVGEIGGLIRNMSSHGMLMPACEALMERCRLNDPLVGKLFVRWRDYGQAIGRPLL